MKDKNIIKSLQFEFELRVWVKAWYLDYGSVSRYKFRVCIQG